MKRSFAWSLAAAAAVLLLASACASARPAPTAATATPDTPKPSQQAVSKPPVISDIIGPGSAAPHSDVQLTCRAQDSNGGTLTYSWSVDKGTIKDEGKQATSFTPVATDKKDEDGNPMVGFNSSTGVPVGSIVTWTTPDAAGPCTVTVKVSGSKGGEATFSKSFSVVNPSTSTTTVPGAPSGDTTVYLNLDISSGSAVRESQHMFIMEQQDITCVIKDQDASALTFTWTAPLGGKLVGDGLAEGQASSVGWRAPGVPGHYSVNVVITDKSGHQAQGQVDFDVTIPGAN